jgi:hypothetical protein
MAGLHDQQGDVPSFPSLWLKALTTPISEAEIDAALALIAAHRRAQTRGAQCETARSPGDQVPGT